MIIVLTCLPPSRAETTGREGGLPKIRIPILLYHRFGPGVADSMTVSTPVFESHLRYLKDHGYTVIPLWQLVQYCLGGSSSFPSRSIVIVADDGHKTVHTDMGPLLKKYRIPMTLFIYPSAISHASYAMTWDQLRDLKATGLVDVQSHSFWHPNFNVDKKRLSPVAYEALVEKQLGKSREILEKELNIRVKMLAWPFGIYDEQLIRKAREAGYVAAFSIERRHVTLSDNVMALPRYLMNDKDREKLFERMVASSAQG